jgi:Protein of unknown function (DUF3311)
MKTFLLTTLVILFYVLHQDFWFWREARPLVFGFMPIGLFYHAAFTAACAGLLWVLVTFAWPEHLEQFGEPDGRPRR